jgi:hypothetical protein
VVNKLNGQIPGFWRMVLREGIGKTVSGVFLGLGFFWAIWDKDNQAWHDKIAGTVVVRAGGKLQQRPLQPQTELSSRETPSISAESEQGQPERITSQAQPSQAPTPARVPYKATTQLKPRRHWGRWVFLILLLAIGIFVALPIASGHRPEGLEPQAISRFLVGMWDYWVQIVSGFR